MPNRVLYASRRRARVGETPKVDTRRPGELAPGEDPKKTRIAPAPLPSSVAKGNGYGDFREKQGPDGTYHWGVDIARSPDDMVVSPEHAVVVDVYTNNTTAPWVDYGPAGVLLRGDSGIHHLLAHLDPGAWSEDNRPTKGQVFERGEFVGHTAPTGSPGVYQATPHVHWEVRVKPVDSPSTRKNNTLNPLQWLNGGGSSRTLQEVENGVPASGSGIPWWVWLLGLAMWGKRGR